MPASPRHPRVSLFAALTTQDLAAIRTHLAADVDINAVLDCGLTALAVAASAGFDDGVQFLLAAGASTAEEGVRSPLYLAAANGHASTVRLLLDAGASPQRSATNQSPFLIACQEGHVAVVDLLLATGCDPNALNDDGLSALYLCSFRGQSAVASSLLAAGAKVDFQTPNGSFPLFVAAQIGVEKLP